MGKRGKGRLKTRPSSLEREVDRSTLSVLINDTTYVMARQPTAPGRGMRDDYLVHTTTMLDLRSSMHVCIQELNIDASVHHELLRPRRIDTAPYGLVLRIPINRYVNLHFGGMYLIDEVFRAHAQPEVTFDVLGKPGWYVCSVVGVQRRRI